MTIDEIKQLVYRVTNFQMAGQMSPEDFNLYCKRAENLLFEELYSAYEATRLISDGLSAFKTELTYMPVASGQYAYPSDYRHATGFVSLKDSEPDKVLEEVPIDKMIYRVLSVILPIEEYPIIVHSASNGFKVYPKNTWVRMYYLKIPTYSKWAYTVVSGRPVYDPTLSIQSSFPESFHIEIAKKILFEAGVQVSRQDLINLNQQ